jgi:O-antigen ligase
MKTNKAPQGLYLALIGASLVTLAVWTKSFDQLIFPKFVLLVLLGSIVIGYLFAGFSNLRSDSTYLLLLALFLVLFVISSFRTDPIHTALFGVQGRNMGLFSYFALLIIALYFFGITEKLSAEKTLYFFSFTSLLMLIYGLLQRFDIDPFNWNVVYEGIIGTLGNPNFMSTFMALGAIGGFGILTLHRSNRSLWAPSALIFIGFIIAIEAAKSTQGWLVLMIGVAPILYFNLERVSKTLSNLFLGVFGTLLVLLGLALNQVGPLSKLIYEQSLLFRADFWNIAWRMALENPWFGVGIDRYQNYYREYKTLEQVKRVGGEDFSDSAHNLYLHFVATGGFPLALSLLLINIYIGYRFIVAYRKFPSSKALVAIFFGLWLGIQAQSLISIDHPAIAVWGWIFGGVGVGLSTLREEKRTPSLGRKYVGLGVSILTLIITLVVVSPAVQAQSMLLRGFYAYVEKGDQGAIRIKDDYLKELESREPGNPTLPILSANSLFQDEAFRETVRAARRAILIDDHDYRSWWFLASALEKDGQRVLAVEARRKTIELAPYNLANLLELAKNQAQAGDSKGLKETQAVMLSIDSNSSESIEANAIKVAP